MRKTTVIYFVAAVALLIFLMSLALPMLKNLAPGFKLFYAVFPVLLMLLTHFTPAEIFRAFKSAGRKSPATKRDLENACLFFKTMQQLLILIMLIGVPVFFVWLLAGPQSTPPQIAHIIAIIIGAFLYPLLFIFFVCLPFKSALRKKMNELP